MIYSQHATEGEYHLHALWVSQNRWEWTVEKYRIKKTVSWGKSKTRDEAEKAAAASVRLAAQPSWTDMGPPIYE